MRVTDCRADHNFTEEGRGLRTALEMPSLSSAGSKKKKKSAFQQVAGSAVHVDVHTGAGE